jgi:acetyl-CoA carboxylase carboxyltransferase component
MSAPTDPAKDPRDLSQIIPENQNTPFDMLALIERVVDAGSFLEIKALFARELITGFARIGGRVVGILANQPKVKGGVLFVDSADKGARFITLCDAFNVPLLFLADVPGFMIGSKVERQGIIRHGAKMIYAVSEATVPKICVIVRKVYGAGLYGMCGPAYGADATLALPTAYIAVMGPEAAVNAVYYNKIMELQGEERERFIRERREEYRRDIDLYKLASRLIVDAIIPPVRLREELIIRFEAYASKQVTGTPKRHGVMPV